jgi:pimeloyl-ACP methyl ester carboxylesterase
MTGYEEHLSDTQTCVVAFASGDGSTIIPDVPNFEFGATLEKLGCSYVLMRCSNAEIWYEAGVEGIGDRTSVASYVALLAHRYRVITVGVSWGAYGALLYGQLGCVQEIIAISPITGTGAMIEPELEKRWHHRIAASHPIDLKPLFMSRPRVARIRAFISDGDGTELDRMMAQRLGIKNINLIPGHSHSGLAKHMRDSGSFERLFT